MLLVVQALQCSVRVSGSARLDTLAVLEMRAHGVDIEWSNSTAVPYVTAQAATL